jgi:hypothetical protein
VQQLLLVLPLALLSLLLLVAVLVLAVVVVLRVALVPRPLHLWQGVVAMQRRLQLSTSACHTT